MFEARYNVINISLSAYKKLVKSENDFTELMKSWDNGDDFLTSDVYDTAETAETEILKSQWLDTRFFNDVDFSFIEISFAVVTDLNNAENKKYFGKYKNINQLYKEHKSK